MTHSYFTTLFILSLPPPTHSLTNFKSSSHPSLIPLPANGLIYPALAYIFAAAFDSIAAGGANSSSDVNTTVYSFIVAGCIGLVAGGVQTLCFEASADKLTHNLRAAWLSALLAQDMSYFDQTKVGDLPSLIQETCSSYRRAVGLKMGQGIQFSTMAVGGIGVAFYFTWQVTLVSLACIPMLALSGYWLVSVNQTAKKASVEDYARAGGTAYVALTNLKTILSMDAARHFVGEYEEKTEKAKEVGVKVRTGGEGEGRERELGEAA